MKKEFQMLGALFSIIIISLFIIENEDKWQASYACSRLEEFKNEDYNGIVLRKYIDQKNHRVETVELRKKNIVFARDTSDFFNFIQKNDSIVKRKDTDVLMVYRLNAIHRFKIYFGCSD